MHTFGFEVVAAKPKREDPDAPRQEPMRPQQQIRQSLSADQKRVRRQMARKATTSSTTDPIKESTMTARREAQILQAMATASLADQRTLATELVSLRSQRAASLQADRDVDLADTVVRAHLTPVATHTLHTAATDWVGEDLQVYSGDPGNEVKTEATLWFRAVSAAVKGDAEEFAIQAHGMANRVAGRFGDQRDGAHTTFLDHVAHLYAKARTAGSEAGPDASSQGESTITDYDTKADQDPLFAEDWGPAGSMGVHPTPVNLQENQGTGGGTAGDDVKTGARRTAGEDDPHGEEQPRIDYEETRGDDLSQPDAATIHEMDPEQFDDWMDREGSRRQSARVGDGPTGEADRCQRCWGKGWIDLGIDFDHTPADNTCPQCKGTGIKKGAAKVASEGQTCSTCGDAIAKDPSGENPSTYHHDNGEKHDHEAQPGSKESRRKTATQVRPLYQIAEDIRANWPNVYFGAVPYLDALGYLNTMADNFGEDDASTVVAYLLSNMTYWRGPEAQRLKAELKSLQGRRASKQAGVYRTPVGPGWDALAAGDKIRVGFEESASTGTFVRIEPNSDADFYGDTPVIVYTDESGSERNYLPHGNESPRKIARTAGTEVGPKDPSVGESGLDDVEVGDEDDRPAYPWEIGETQGFVSGAAKTATGTGPDDEHHEDCQFCAAGEASKHNYEAPEGGSGRGAADVADVRTPGGEAGYPQPHESALETIDLDVVAAFRQRVQANLAKQV